MAPDAEAAEEQARARVALLIRRAGRGLLRMTPYAILGTLCAGAMVPLAAVGIGGVAGAGLQVLGGVGGNILAGVIAQAMESLRLRTGCGDPAPDEIEREIADRLAAMLVGDSSRVLHCAGRSRRCCTASTHRAWRWRRSIRTATSNFRSISPPRSLAWAANSPSSACCSTTWTGRPGRSWMSCACRPPNTAATAI